MTIRREDAAVPGNRVRELRTGRGISQANLAERVGVSRRTMGWIEDRTHAPSLVTAIRIARVLRRSVETVFVVERETPVRRRQPVPPGLRPFVKGDPNKDDDTNG